MGSTVAYPKDFDYDFINEETGLNNYVPITMQSIKWVVPPIDLIVRIALFLCLVNFGKTEPTYLTQGQYNDKHRNQR